MADVENLIAIKDLVKSFDDHGNRIDILKGASFYLNKGESVGIVGASGIGKSSFLHILGTLDRPDSGSFAFQGEDLLSFDNEKLAKIRNESIGFVFQFHHLLPEFSSMENVMLPGMIKGENKEKNRKTAEKILIRVGLKDRLNYRVSKLSGGEQQRVALARALVLKPVVLLADEPTGNLDKDNSRQIHNLLMELNIELGMAMVVVTHNIELSSFMSRRITISDGLLIETG